MWGAHSFFSLLALEGLPFFTNFLSVYQFDSFSLLFVNVLHYHIALSSSLILNWTFTWCYLNQWCGKDSPVPLHSGSHQRRRPGIHPGKAFHHLQEEREEEREKDFSHSPCICNITYWDNRMFVFILNLRFI